jgi:hypothetical protein
MLLPLLLLSLLILRPALRTESAANACIEMSLVMRRTLAPALGADPAADARRLLLLLLLQLLRLLLPLLPLPRHGRVPC